jgi:hypothetical protein
MATRMQQRRGTAAQWTAANPVLAAGEIGFETDTNKFKMGNGSSAWTALQYFANAAELAAIIDGAPDLLNTLNELAAAIGDDPAFFTNIAESISDNIDLHNVTTNVHGIANTSLLATTANVGTAKTEAIADAATAAGQALTSHNNLTTGVHGIDNTANLATTSSVSTAISNHNDVTTNVHGITDTEELATKTYADTAVTTHNSETTNVHGIANTALLATTANITTHNEATENVHGILDTADLATQEYVNTAVGNSTVDQSLLAGVGIEWNTETDQFDIDSTVATKTYADGAVSSAVTALTKSSVGLENVDNTSDANKPVSTATQTALDLKAPLANPTFTGTVAGVTKAHVGLGNVDNTADSAKPVSTAQATAIATAKSEAIADATAQVNAVIASAPAALNTLDELAAALGDDANFATTVTTSLAAKAPLASPTFTGTVTVAAAGVAFTDGTQTKEGVQSRTPIIAKTDSYTLSALTERDSLIEVAKATATTITIPTDATLNFPIGTSLDILQTSTGQVTIAGAAGVTVNATPGLKLRTTWSSATLFKRAANTWVVYGDLTA